MIDTKVKAARHPNSRSSNPEQPTKKPNTEKNLLGSIERLSSSMADRWLVVLSIIFGRRQQSAGWPLATL